jgi:hypothetical protein
MELNRAPPLALGDADDDVSIAGVPMVRSNSGGQPSTAAVDVTGSDQCEYSIDLAPKLMCLTGTDAYKFSRQKLIKKQWHVPAHKTLVAVGRGRISWTGHQPIRYISANVGPSEALENLM